MSAPRAGRSIAAAPPIRSAPCAAPVIRSTSGSAGRRNVRKGGIGAAQFGTLGRTLGSRTRRTPVAPGCRRLIGNAPVISAIRCSGGGLATAEEEVRLAGVADRPVALFLVEFEERAALPDRDDVLDRLRLGLRLVIVGRHMRERGI